MMEKLVLSLGSNLGNRAAYIEQAQELIAAKIGEIVRKSSILETEAWGFEAPPFLNQVLVLQTQLDPFEVLKQIQSIENQLGRTHKRKGIHDSQPYQDRTIDIDILYYGNLCLHTEELCLPHPYIQDRDFILQCLAEIELC